MLAVIDSRTNENYTLNIANRFYVQQGFFTRESFARALRFYYGETLHKFDYERNNQLAQVLSVLKSKIETKRERWWSQENNNNAILLQEINNWVSEKTRSKITELITADDVNKDIVLMMRLRAKFPYYEDDSVQVVKLPYVGDEVEMVLILPKIRFNIANVLKNMTGEYLLSYVDRAVPDIVLLKLPRFRLEAKLDLKGTLQRIGIRDAFSERANFRELTDDAVFVGGVMHKGFIEVNEKGTESAAATVIDIVPRMLMESKPFIADQPFLFAIVRNSDTILFAGQFAK
uniref:SERPIN domain-containing protein n=1 Tax=Loa loa TaxID=7209 RepID=A0A1I7VAY7_LOALO